ncbi:MAG: hypothetical protein CMK74_17955 [Pseudomonadales bacterium]|jgi:hypothetical protein|nr:hypothetical protein [Pseudomonadales bacterium]
MPITNSKYTGTWLLQDVIALAVAQERTASKLKNPDGSPQIATRYLASAQLIGGDQPVEARAIIPKKVFRKVRKLLAPYVMDEAVAAFDGTTKSPEVGDPDPADLD